ncbi:MAG: histidine--tRNA ligase [Halanaerobiaceae bacterium]|nr:histidine--tRNA ligase [Halanaerobiaceae bacterium]
MKMNAPRGTNDILPPLSLKWQYIEEAAKDIMARYNYQEIRTPIFEYTELFLRSIGETTDVVEKEMYTFADKGGRSITLRPEGTAGIVRAYLENKLYGQMQPVKLFYIGPMFRYERPQAGRFRQFHQLGVEVFGSNDPALDAEVITLGVNYLKELGLENLDIYINSIGCPECRQEYFKDLQEYFNQDRQDLCEDCQSRIDRNPMRVLDCKVDNSKEIVRNAPSILDYLCPGCQEHFASVREYLSVLGLEYTIDARMVRGLDYYTNTVFEIKYSGLGAQDTILAGGRYNGLAEEIGGKSIPGVGFAAGMERLLLTLEKEGLELPDSSELDIFMVTIGAEARKEGLRYLYQFRNKGYKAEFDYLERSIKSQLKAADRLRARYVIILGENELAQGKALVRNMETGKQQEIALEKILEEDYRKE